jgi:hypothetical protein
MSTNQKEREITPVTFAHVTSSSLNERRFWPHFIEQVVAGPESILMPDAAEMAAAATE